LAIYVNAFLCALRHNYRHRNQVGQELGCVINGVTEIMEGMTMTKEEKKAGRPCSRLLAPVLGH
jgi:hypothetical protein